MRHSSFSRSTRQRLQKLTAFLTSVAMVAGFLPFQALTVMADPDPNPAPEGTEFTVVLNDDDNMDTRWMSIQYKTSDGGKWIDLDDEEISVTPTENGYECKFTIAGDGYLDIKYDLGG